MTSAFSIGSKKIGANEPIYFIADIAANHDGSLERAKDLIWKAAEAGAHAAKFQNFFAAKIVSDKGFKDLGSQQSHQASWKKSVYQVYEEASLSWDWTEELKICCDQAGIHYFSSPYDFGAVDMLLPHVPAYKIGSGDVTWIEMIEYIAKKNKPVLIATGAATLDDVKRAMCAIQKFNNQIVLMQCNTNYTAAKENFKYINLNVLKTYSQLYPDVLLGLSDHTSGCSTVLGAIALGARVIEKHFTDDTHREGPDHKFSMDPVTWREMVDRSEELQFALGDGIKRVEENEKQTAILQQRCVRAAKTLSAGQILSYQDVECLRPCPEGAIKPYELDRVVGATLRNDLEFGSHLSEEIISA